MTERRPIVLVLRPEPGAAATADRLIARGLDAIPTPTTTIRRLGRADAADLVGAQAVAFTSAAAARLVGADLSSSVASAPPAYCVGDATAAAALASGFETTISAGGDAAALAARLAALDPAAGSIVHYSARDAAADLAALIVQLSAPFGTNVQVVRRIVYAAEPATALPDASLRMLSQGRVAALLALSSRAAEAFLALARRHAPEQALDGVIAVAVSARVAAVFRAKPRIRTVVASEPTETAAADALLRWFERPDGRS